jgi:ATP-dependent RNA helicase DDX5/DBP2
VLLDFKNGTSPIMVATDVASRGLDVKDIKLVINYDFPTQVHCPHHATSLSPCQP